MYIIIRSIFECACKCHTLYVLHLAEALDLQKGLPSAIFGQARRETPLYGL